MDMASLLIGSGAGIAAHDYLTHDGAPSDRIHGWHVGLALLGLGVGLKVYEHLEEG